MLYLAIFILFISLAVLSLLAARMLVIDFKTKDDSI
jgi:hypothetical protein